MRVNLDDIGDGGLTLRTPIEQAWLNTVLGESSAYRAYEDGELNAQVMRIEDVVHLRGESRLPLDSQCSRCTTELKTVVVLPYTATYFPEDSFPEVDEENGLDGDMLDSTTYSGDTIDLSLAVRDEICLSLEPYPLCKPDCLGLCQQCGVDLNHEPCTCEKQVDLRWAALQSIQVKKN